MNYMSCTTCHATVTANNTGVCLKCQNQTSVPQGDEWRAKKVEAMREVLEKTIFTEEKEE